MRTRILATTVVLCCAPHVAHAQASYRLAPVGGRTTLLGGTGVVFGRDTGGTFLNPATAVRIDKNRLSFSVDFYYLSLVNSGSWYQPGTIDKPRFGDVAVDGNTAVSAFDFDSLPGSLCLFFGVGDLPFLARKASAELRARQARLGICLASTIYNAFTFNAEDYEQRTPTGVSRQAHNLRQTFRRISVGPTYSMYVDNQLTIGASLHASRSSHRSIIGATATTYGGDAGPISTMVYRVSRGDSHELTATIGATYRISKRQTIGISIASPSFHLFGSGGVNHQTDYRGAGVGADTSSFAADGAFVTRTPPRVAIGTGVEGSWGSAELNVAFHAPLGAAYSADLEGRSLRIAPDDSVSDREEKVHLSTRALGAVNFGVGGEVFTSPRISLLGGFNTDTSIVPRGALEQDPFNYYPSRMHRIATSFGVGSHGAGGDLLIGTELSYGWGERLTPNSYQLPPRLDRADQELFGFLFVLAGSTSFRTFQRAVEDVKKALDPKDSQQQKQPGPPSAAPKTP
ncbi:MAG TPA: hypothetical protein VM925_02515 [Labilithrix sp.]|nr:hypothetical protein [Labilithrix sp.]